LIETLVSDTLAMGLFVKAAATDACAFDRIGSGLFLKGKVGILIVGFEGLLSAIAVVSLIKVGLALDSLKSVMVFFNLVLKL
jgi:hypothetical protein